jgi:hypothetical protein
MNRHGCMQTTRLTRGILNATLLATLALSGCAPSYTLVAAAPQRVASNTLQVSPGVAWNRAPKSPLDVRWQENGTENGALLDSIVFVGGVPDGQAIAKQRRKADHQVPVFRATMTARDLVAMIESYYRITAGAAVFEAGEVTPVTFVGKPGLRFDYSYVGADNVRRRGRSVMAISGSKLYLMSLAGAALHYYAAALPDFDAMAVSASVG